MSRFIFVVYASMHLNHNYYAKVIFISTRMKEIIKLIWFFVQTYLSFTNSFQSCYFSQIFVIKSYAYVHSNQTWRLIWIEISNLTFHSFSKKNDFPVICVSDECWNEYYWVFNWVFPLMLLYGIKVWYEAYDMYFDISSYSFKLMRHKVTSNVFKSLRLKSCTYSKGSLNHLTILHLHTIFCQQFIE